MRRKELFWNVFGNLVAVIIYANKKNYQSAIKNWNRISDNASSFFSLQIKPFIKLLHRQNSLQNWFRGIAKDLGNKSLEKRKEATTSLIHAGVLAFPVLRKLKISKNPEVRSRAKNLIQKCMLKWNDIFNN